MKSLEYSSTSKAFHWLIVALVGLEFLMAWIMPGVRRNFANPAGIVMIHMSVGLVILLVMAFRLVWRLMHPVPASPEGALHWQEIAAKATHYALYASLIAVPFAGWAWASSLGWPVSLFGLVTLPGLVPKSAAIVRIAGPAHAFLAAIIVGLVGFHALAAFYHWIFLDDGVMERMVPRYFLKKKVQ
jgi:cytochrome b561